MSESLLDNINEIEALFCDHSIQNRQIIQSHSLEILLSFSNEQQFIDIMKDKKNLLKEMVTILNEDNKLDYKILLLLVNLSADKQISEFLVEKNAINILMELIFAKMKKLTNQHIQIKHSIVDEDNKNQDQEFCVYNLSDKKIPKEQAVLLMDIDSIKFALFLFLNLITNNEKARDQLVQKNQEKQCHNLTILIDWTCDSNLNDLFQKLIPVLINLSVHEDMRKIMNNSCIDYIFQLNSFYQKNENFQQQEEVLKILRNLSFEDENIKFIENIQKPNTINEINEFLCNKNYSEQNKSCYAKYIVDILASIMTSKNFDENTNIKKDEIFDERFQTLITNLKMVNFEKAETADRFMVIETLYDEYESLNQQID